MILTSVTTIFGLTAFLTPVAVVIVWGLSFATLLTLLLVPSIYAIVDDIAGRLDRARFEKARKAKEPDYSEYRPAVSLLPIARIYRPESED